MLYLNCLWGLLLSTYQDYVIQKDQLQLMVLSYHHFSLLQVQQALFNGRLAKLSSLRHTRKNFKFFNRN